MRLLGTKLAANSSHRGFGDQLYDLSGQRPSLDLQFANQKSLVDATTGQNLVSFTRASSGTYVDSQGVIRTATTNLLLRSEEIGTSPWGTNNAGATTYTANATAAPTGAVTADRVTATADFAGPNQFVSAISGLNYSLSFYVKAVTPGSLDSIRIECFGGRFAQFNITTRVFSGVNAAITPSSISLGDGWVRVQCLFAAPSTGSLAVAVYASTSSDFYLWGAQLEQSSTVGEYIPTTSTTNSAPRFDHNPTTGESLGLLAEESRTNLLLRSEDLANTWITFGTTVTANAAVAPDGTTAADKLINNTANSEHGIYQITTTSGAHTFTVFAKQAELRYLVLRRDTAVSLIAVYDLQAGTVSQTDAGVTAAITPFPNGWYRCSMTCSTPTGNTVIKLSDVGTGVVFNSTYTGTAGQGILIWGAQLEAGAFPTSYIPTTTATATRSADVASISGSNFSSWYRQDEGTWFAQHDVRNMILSANNNTFSERQPQMGLGAGLLHDFYSITGGVIQANSVGGAHVIGAPDRVVYAVKANDFIGALNGALFGADTSGLFGSLITQLNIGSLHTGASASNGTIRRLTYWPQRLSNSTLQSITQ